MTIGDRLPRHWLLGQRVALGAKRLPSQPKAAEREFVLEEVIDGFVFDEGETALPPHQAERYLTRLASFPPNALHALSSLQTASLGSHYGRYQNYWNEALRRIRHSEGVSPFAGAKLIADRLMSANLTAPQLVRIAADELRATWPTGKQFYVALNRLAECLGKGGLNMETRVGSLADFRNEVLGIEGSIPERWELVENAILQQIFAWPLLIVNIADRKFEYSLPIAVDIFMDGKPRDRFLSDGSIDYSNWETPLQNALKAAKELWKHKHGSWPRDFKELIDAADVVVDLRAAEAVVRPYGGIELTGSSAEASLALLITANFLLDRAAMETTCATGKLGRRRKDREGGGDHYIEFMSSDILKLKQKAANDALLIDTFVAPLCDEVVTKDHLRVCKGKTLSDFANHVFRQGWRKHRYIRTPDVALAYRPADKSQRWSGGIDSEVGFVLNELRGNSNPVFEFARPINVTSVAKALYYLNTQSTYEAEKSGVNPKEWAARFAFVRVVPDEINDRFWWTLWDAVDGSNESFFDFRFLTSRVEAGEVLARELNKFHPTKEDPHRAPDMLVIIGSDHIDRTRSAIANGPFHRLQLQSLRKTLETKLVPTPSPAIAKRVGRTRIILIPKEETQHNEGSDRTRYHPYSPELADALAKLSIFRYGFTFEMARHLLGASDEDCERILSDLSGPKCESNRQEASYYLNYAEGAGEYFLANRPRADAPQKDLARLHYLAANAIVGFLDPDQNFVRYNYREALSPVWLHEAQWHLRQARQLGYEHASRSHERLSRIAEPFGWTRIRYAAGRSKEDGTELLSALQEHLENIRTRPDWRKYRHSVEFVLAAKFARRLSEQIKPNEATRKEELRSISELFLKWASDACADLKPNEHDACRYVIATSRACMALTDAPNGDGLRLASKYIGEATELQKYETELLDSEWFEFMGDRECDPERAAAAYLKGLWNAAIPMTKSPLTGTLVKYLGTVCLAGINPPKAILDQLELLPQRRKHVPPRNDKSGLSELSYVQERWRVGRKVLLTGDFSSHPPQKGPNTWRRRAA